MPRYFTRDQALTFLPKIERLIRGALALKTEMQTVERELRAASRRITMLGGVIVRHQEFLDLRTRHDAAVTAIREAVEQIHETGCQVKDLDIGLIDFPTLYRGEEVLLCWKLGETGIDFWHGLEDGFRGRKPIDDEFLSNHRGGAGEAA